MKKKSKKIWLFVFIPFLFIIALLGTILIAPQMVFNGYFIAKAARYVKVFGVDINWKELQVETSSAGLLDKKIELSFTDLCVEKGPELDSACFTLALFGFRYRFQSIVPSLVEVGPVRLEGGEVVVKVAGNETKLEKKLDTSKFTIPELVLPRILSNAEIMPVSVDIRSLLVKLPNGELKARMNLEMLENLHIDADIEKIPERVALKLSFDAKSESRFKIIDAKINGHADIKSNEAGNVSAVFNIEQGADKRVTYSSDLKFDRKTLTALLKLSGHVATGSILADLALDAKDSSLLVNRATINKCQLTLDMVRASKNDGRLKFDCPVRLFIKKIELPDEVETVYHPPDIVDLTLKAALDTFFLPELGHSTKGNVELNIASSQSGMVKTSGYLNIALDGTMDDLPKSMKISGKSDLDFKILQFARLVDILENSPFSIPAPFNIMAGEVDIGIRGEIPSFEELSYFPMTLTTRLEGPQEKIYLDATGKATFRLDGKDLSASKVEMELVLTKVEFPLPDIQLASLPQLAPDKRIKESPEDKKPEKELPVDYLLSVLTPEESPVKISSNMAKEPVPIGINIRGDKEGFTGKVNINNFTLKLFRSEARIKKINFDIKQPAEQSTVSAEISLKASEYEIIIKMVGLLSRPTIWFESNPPLSEEDIVSVLLYGEPYDELDSEMSGSVGNMRAATANKAMAFTTFIILASTPIQSIIYDPATKQITARIRLDDKTSLSVGSSGEGKKGVGIRRRLGKGWIVRTSFDKNNYDGTTSVATFVEWHQRY
ncbi:MAG: hypothetical protein COV46_03605 [Deltaproteobacteria bacterium CG11_big_fil_rev_8_21_14_0_20_49_13]|nr:MAG: hypothetical protein COV46_03605 [Deltaproteobacteria bacterium CG11_big_fil_rev_8_21_14_0_20_49_13]